MINLFNIIIHFLMQIITYVGNFISAQKNIWVEGVPYLR